MPAFQYPFIDIAVHERVRGHFAAGEAAVLFSPDMDMALWANGRGADLFGFSSIYDFLDQGPVRSDVTFRQAEAAALQLAGPGDRRELTIRITAGFQRVAAKAVCELIEVQGEPVVLFTAAVAGGRLSAAASAARMIEGLGDPDTHIAVVSGRGETIARSRDFNALELSEASTARLAASADYDTSRVAKRPVPTARGFLPAAIGKLADEPALYLLVVVEPGKDVFAEDSQPAEEPAVDDADDNIEAVEAEHEVATNPEGFEAAMSAVAAIEDEPEQTEEIVLDVPEPAALADQDGFADAESVAEADEISETGEIRDDAQETGQDVGQDADHDTGSEEPVEAPQVRGLPEPETAELAPDVTDTKIETPLDEVTAGEAITKAAIASDNEDEFVFRRDGRAVRFVWKIDSHGHFTEISPEFAQSVGPHAADIIGMAFADLATLFNLDPSGKITELLGKRDTWSGKTIFWPVEGSSLRVPVDLAALPTYTRSREFDGFRGFGIVRVADAIEDPQQTGLTFGANAEFDDTALEEASDEIEGALSFPLDQPETEASDAAAAESADETVDAAASEPETAEEADAGAGSDTPAVSSPDLDWPPGERPALRIVENPGRRHSDKVIRFDERRAQLSVGERAAFQEIARQLDRFTGQPAANDDSAEQRPTSDDQVTDASKAAEDVSATTADDSISHATAEGGADHAAADTGAQETVSEVETETETVTVVSPEVEDEQAEELVDTDDEATATASADGTLDEAVENEAAEPDHSVGSAEDKAAKASLSAIDDNAEFAPVSDDPAVTSEEAVSEQADKQADATEAEIEAEAEAETEEESAEEDGPAEESPDEAVALSATAAALQNADAQPEEPSERELLSRMMPGRERIGLSAEIIDQMPVALLVHSGDDLIHGNPEFLRLTGYGSIGELAEIGGLDALLQRQELEGKTANASGMVVVRADDEIVPVTARLQSVRWEDATALMLALMPVAAASGDDAATDAAQALPLRPVVRPADQIVRLQVEVDEMRSILETATDGVVIIDGNGDIRSLNRSASALFNYDAEEVEGKPFVVLFAHESHKSVLDYLGGLSGHGVASVLNDGREVIGREAAGGFLPLFMTIGRLTSSNGYCAVIRDITQWKRTEEELRTAKRAAETANAHKSEFLAHVSHEIRTPLNAIIGFSDMMASERFGPVGHPRYIEYANDIGRSGRHVLDIVNDLLDISKIEAGEMEMDFVAVGLNESVSEAVSLVQPQANGQRVIIRTALSNAVPQVVADLRSIKQIVLNILSNAIRFTPSGGQIVVSTAYEANGSVVLRIRDTGIGMSRAELELAMKPFRQVPGGTRNRGDGTGLGLPLTKAMVDANRALFAISSEPNEGTLVEISFPSQRVLAT